MRLASTRTDCPVALFLDGPAVLLVHRGRVAHVETNAGGTSATCSSVAAISAAKRTSNWSNVGTRGLSVEAITNVGRLAVFVSALSWPIRSISSGFGVWWSMRIRSKSDARAMRR